MARGYNKEIKEMLEKMGKGEIMEPKGILKFVKCTATQKGEIAIFITIIFEDEEGKQWELKSSSFLFDLSEIK
jgi:hypothetical protein